MANRHTKILARIAGAALLLAAAAAVQAQEAGDEVRARYTAQQRPRMAVLEFDDTNTEASKAKYASSVEAMLVTFLQRQSQFAIVEREKLGGLYEEKRRIQQGLVDVPPGDTSDQGLLEKIDAYVLGTVTLLDGSRIEIDAKLFSGFDGRVVATAQRSGPVTCLRSVVERLGSALEQDFLRPYHSNLEIRLTTPENVHISLTSIPMDTASPAERSSTVKVGSEFDTVEPWITNPKGYTIENLLPGWYSLRLARPGYEDLKMDNGRWEARLRSGRLDVYDRMTGSPLSRTDPELRRFVVRVAPRTTEVIDGDALGFILRKKSGSLTPRVKRQYIDKDFKRSPGRAILMGGRGLDLNHSQRTESGGDAKCDLLREQPPSLPAYARTYVAAGQTFDFAAFQGGELIIEDYRGETVPSGKYQLALWDTHYKVKKIDVTVRDGDHGEVVQSDLARETLPATLKTTGAQPPAYRLILEGRETRHRRELPLDFTDAEEQRGLPADTYKVSTNVAGLDRWKGTLDHFPGNAIPPRYYSRSPAYAPEVTSTYEDRPVRPSSLIVKTRFVLAGRLDVLSSTPEPRSAELIDDEVGNVLDRLLHEPETQPGASGELRQLLTEHLEVIDLLVLNPRDMARLRQSSETAGIVQGYVNKGGALFAFVSDPGDYSMIAGAPLMIEAPGKVSTRRSSLKLSNLSPDSWRVIAFTEGRGAPRVLERGDKKSGGYVALWLDHPSSFRDRSGRAAPKVQETRGKVEEHVLNWARYLMYRRYDKAGKLRRRAEEELGW